MAEIIEHGDIQFWFRPSVQPAEALAYKLGVQSLFAVLSPAGGRLHRRLRIGRKRMPARSRDRFWARVERVGSLQRVLGDLLEAERYTTKTRGERYQPAARPLAHGGYAFVRHEERLHLSYDLDARDRDDLGGTGDAIDELPRLTSASHLVLFKAPTEGPRVWSTAGAPRVLDDEDAQIVLVGARPPLQQAAGPADGDAPPAAAPAEVSAREVRPGRSARSAARSRS
jgi:hypothetical protein